MLQAQPLRATSGCNDSQQRQVSRAMSGSTLEKRGQRQQTVLPPISASWNSHDLAFPAISSHSIDRKIAEQMTCLKAKQS
jgi:hypothetical protein